MTVTFAITLGGTLFASETVGRDLLAEEDVS